MTVHEYRSPTHVEIDDILRRASALRAMEMRRLARALLAWAGRPLFGADPDLRPSV